jgi:hypothetical protein
MAISALCTMCAPVAAEGDDAGAAAIRSQLEPGAVVVPLLEAAADDAAGQAGYHPVPHPCDRQDQGGGRRHAREPGVEGVLEGGVAAVVVEVLTVEVGEDGDRRFDAGEAAVALVGLGDEQLTVAGARAAAQGCHRAPHHHHRIEPRLGEQMTEHPGGRGLAMAARDRQGARPGHQADQALAAGHHRDAAPAGLGQFGMICVNRRRMHHQVDTLEVGGGMAEMDGDALAAQGGDARPLLLVAAGDRRAGLERQRCERPDTGSADADQMDVPATELP